MPIALDWSTWGVTRSFWFLLGCEGEQGGTEVLFNKWTICLPFFLSVACQASLPSETKSWDSEGHFKSLHVHSLQRYLERFQSDAVSVKVWESLCCAGLVWVTSNSLNETLREPPKSMNQISLGCAHEQLGRSFTGSTARG